MDYEKVKEFVSAHKTEICCLVVGMLAGELRTYRKIAKALKKTVMSFND